MACYAGGSATYNRQFRLISVFVFWFALPVFSAAELQTLGEAEMSEIDGAGIGLVFDNFTFSHGTDRPDADGNQSRIFRISGIKSTDGQEVDITVNHLYIAGANTNYGENLTPVNLGRLVNPWRIDVVDGNDIGIANKAVLEFAGPSKIAPTEGFDCMGGSAAAGSGSCSSRPATDSWIGERADIGMQMNVAVGDDRSANLNIHAKSAVIDGSYLRLWGDDQRQQMAGQFKLNFYSPELSINACTQDGATCGSRITMSDFALELAIGNSLQPVYFDVDGNGNFILEVDAIRAPGAGQIAANGLRAGSNAQTWDFYEDYYSNPELRSNLSIGNFSVGDKDFGTARVQGMLIQHLRIQTKDLAP
ncbi:hypothetical protein [Marinobacter halophilus]|uniref:Uncharacterized protein n=1 Tax=Marinobacter halophilus TaxID=1323740 RepID=A0A2T1KGH5_9GAMM|nr:hypothetical protein [Marinobacter halophilus]PSF09225.1 hypothetical protein C7H08_05410 [Marinobacter halophilus]GGC84085.1 hypothetical protein GCM10011362_35570 [Marinobacter halophilus]